MDPLQRVALLQACPLFTQLPPADVQHLAETTSARHYRRGQLVFVAGDPGDSLLVVAHGQLKVQTRSESGEELLLAVVGPPNSLGELTVADGGPRSATVEALTDAVTLRVERAEILRLAAGVPAVNEALVPMLAAVARRLTGTAADLVFLDLPRRLAKLLLEQQRAGGSDVVNLPWTQTDIASSIGASRQSVNATLKDFQRRGWITPAEQRSGLANQAALTRFAQS